MRKLILALMGLFFVGCSSNSSTKTKDSANTQKIDSNQIKTGEIKANKETSSAQYNKDTSEIARWNAIVIPEKKLKNDTIYYHFINDTLEQHIGVRFLTETKIFFSYRVTNKKVNKSAFQSGYAILPYGRGDTEEDNDEEGEGYSVYEYVFKKKGCKDVLSIRIDSEKQNKLLIIGSSCQPYERYCPFPSVGILRYVNK